ncbi:hypothetical protein [Thioclava sp. DLFJ4-1]|uniref:hypothetical protein n=1 Tax=Thioclava sp. DLFJ4-1 TaxID=1915313 RepID=UPI00099705C7|nr:hypothetical protein [Thioclava sp. DLFJ4-1]OOY16743.1 hypothetical protein BMI85_06670 [Thioclava sp. DLFJ4-1]
MTESYDRLRDQFIRDETAKAERQDAEFFSSQEHLNSNAIRADSWQDALRLGPVVLALTIAIACVALIALIP